MIEDDDRLLTPREVADMFEVRTTTVARWARDGRLAAQRTPGGHRRYLLSDVRQVLGADAQDRLEARRLAPDDPVRDAIRLYEQGWSIRRVAAEFGLSYGAMRRVLRRHVRLRER